MVQTQQNFPGLQISGGCLIKYFAQIIAVLFYIPVSTIEWLPPPMAQWVKNLPTNW